MMLDRLQVKALPFVGRAQDVVPVALCCKECATASAVGFLGVGLVGFRCSLRQLLRRA